MFLLGSGSPNKGEKKDVAVYASDLMEFRIMEHLTFI
jgi:hypothetical protein